MKHYRYLLIGGGIAADSAARGIRQIDTGGSIGLISQEPDPPYNRPPLSKGLWGRMPLKRIWRGTADLGVELHLNQHAAALDPALRRLTTASGEEFTYDRLLLATGGSPVQIAPPSGRILYYRTLQDYQRLRALAESGQRFVVLGGGFIGAEIAAALAQQGKDVTMIFPEGNINGRIFPAEQSIFLTETYRQRGIRVLNRTMVTGLSDEGERVRVEIGAEQLWFDAAVAGLGVRPNIGLAASAGLAVELGIVVDAYLRTEHEDIFAAGDVMEFHQRALGSRMRVEHEENANMSGLAAGRGMAGELEPYTLLPSFYSDLFDLSYQAVGELDSRHTVVMDWQEPHRQGVIYYLSGERLRGVALWNRPYDHVQEARRLVESQELFAPEDLPGAIQG